jgi:SP family general alpha glucoside:H+ symporter-like MFS transporter
MEGFDRTLLNSLYSQPNFQKNYGKYFPEINHYHASAKWQTSLSMTILVGVHWLVDSWYYF